MNMKPICTNLLSQFEKIVELVNEKGLTDSFYADAKEHLDAVSGLLQISQVQSVLFALMLERVGRNSVSIDKIAETLKCGKIQLLRYMDDFEALKKKRLIRACGRSRFLSASDNFPEYTVPMDVIKAIRSNTGYEFTAYDNLSLEGFFDCMEALAKNLKDDEIDRESWNEEIEYLFSRNRDIAFVKKQKEYGLEEDSVAVMFLFCGTVFRENKETISSSEMINELRGFFDYHEARLIHKRFESGEHTLIKKGLVEFDCQNGLADTEYYRLTQKAKDDFLADLELREKTKHRGKNFIRSENICAKKLFYSEKIKHQIGELTELLREKNFCNIQKRLEESGMRSGFACLFSGSPGTGKTETAYQIARETGRDIMLVDISETKSMWFGESEKRIKAVFDRYRGVVKSGGPAPILLFNEADAVLGKRRELSQSSSGPGQTENAIQNIILQELENLNGILIATTNMTANLDKAFDRRFLYKVEFAKPDIESKKLMWQSHIPCISGDDAAQLAAMFDFSGGQIENISRKSTVSFILNGISPDLSTLETLCREESAEKTEVKIGFCVA